MNKITVSDCPPWDGDYTFDSFNLTNRELNRIKVISAVDDAAPIRAGELIEALFMSDRAAVVALTVVILGREGKTVDPDDLLDSPAGALRLEIDLGDDADPPTTASSDSEPNEPETSSGDGSASDGD
jgi:hypothetical protein